MPQKCEGRLQRWRWRPNEVFGLVGFWGDDDVIQCFVFVFFGGEVIAKGMDTVPFLLPTWNFSNPIVCSYRELVPHFPSRCFRAGSNQALG